MGYMILRVVALAVLLMLPMSSCSRTQSAVGTSTTTTTATVPKDFVWPADVLLAVAVRMNEGTALSTAASDIGVPTSAFELLDSGAVGLSVNVPYVAVYGSASGAGDELVVSSACLVPLDGLWWVRNTPCDGALENSVNPPAASSDLAAPNAAVAAAGAVQDAAFRAARASKPFGPEEVSVLAVATSTPALPAVAVGDRLQVTSRGIPASSACSFADLSGGWPVVLTTPALCPEA